MRPSDTDQQVHAAVVEHSKTADLFAERYAAMAEDPFRGTFTYSRIRLDELLDSKVPADGHGLRLLDVGCGTGHQLSKYRGRGFEVAGIDASQEMLDHATRNNPGAELVLSE